MTSMVPAGQSPFDSIQHFDADGNEYWSARELAKLLGYASWQNFEGVIADAMTAASKSGNDPDAYFNEAVKISVGKQRTRRLNDYHLTRYACYLIAQNADPSKDIVAQAQTYFAVQTRAQELLGQVDEIQERIARRQQLSDAHKQLLARAKAAGVITSEQYATFMDSGYRGLYAGERENDIHARKQLQPQQKISDHMGAIETLANALRAEITARRMNTQGTRTPPEANDTHYDVGKTIRGWFVSEGIYPEQLPTPQKSYRQIVKEEAARIAEEERQEALEQEYRSGLWGQLPASDES